MDFVRWKVNSSRKILGANIQRLFILASQAEKYLNCICNCISSQSKCHIERPPAGRAGSRDVFVSLSTALKRTKTKH
jgi:hypothetical protein